MTAWQKKTGALAALALLLSLLLHTLLLSVAARIPFHAFRRLSAARVRPHQRLALHTINIRDRVFPEAAPVAPDQRLLFRSPAEQAEELHRLFRDMNLLPKPQPDVRLAGLGQSVAPPALAAAPSPQPPAVPPPRILEIDAADLAPERLSGSRDTVPKVSRQELLGDHVPGLTGAAGGAGGPGETIEVGMRLGRLPGIGLSAEELAGLERRPAAPAAPAPPGTAVFTVGNEGAGRLEDLVTIQVFAYDPPDGRDRFFRIDIAPNPRSGRLRTVAKDMLFLVDCSASISQSKLNQFKQGVAAALKYLSPSDGFNVVAFRDQPQPLFPASSPVTPENVAAALRFLDLQERGGLTDVYRSLTPFVQAAAAAARYRPLNVFLLSDGRSTVRDRIDNDTFIRQIVSLRQNHVSVYSFSAGTDANLFLLDLLAYSNRGRSVHVETLSRFSPHIAEFIRTHADLIVADLRYRATGDVGRDVYPKGLPHLYRGETLSLFGRCPAALDSIGLQIVGRDADGQEQELVFRCDLRLAPKAGPRLAVDWAAQKVYYLLAERALRPESDPAAEIRRLAEQYKLYVPYL